MYYGKQTTNIIEKSEIFRVEIFNFDPWVSLYRDSL